MSRTDGYKERKRKLNKKAIEDAYEAYVRREPGSLDNLLTLVSIFAKRKIHSVESDPEFKQLGTACTGDDFAQEAVIAVWKGLDRGVFRGDVSNFYAWMHSIVFSHKKQLESEILEQKCTKVPLLVNRKVGQDEKVSCSDKDEYEEVDNPVIHARPAVSDIGCTIPASVQGVDLTICKLLLTTVRGEDGRERGRTYAEVGFILGMTEDAVTKRMERVRVRNIANKESKKAEYRQRRLDEETERRNSVSIGLAKIRVAKP